MWSSVSVLEVGMITVAFAAAAIVALEDGAQGAPVAPQRAFVHGEAVLELVRGRDADRAEHQGEPERRKEGTVHG